MKETFVSSVSSDFTIKFYNKIKCRKGSIDYKRDIENRN